MVGLKVVQHLIDDEIAVILTMGLRWVIRMPHIQANHGLLTTLSKWLHSEHNTFHLPTSLALITLEDVYHILQVPCYGDLVSCTFD